MQKEKVKGYSLEEVYFARLYQAMIDRLEDRRRDWERRRAEEEAESALEDEIREDRAS